MGNMSERIKQAMNANNMKQNELAKKSGLSKASISNYVSGKIRPKPTHAYAMSEVLKVSYDWLLGRD